MKLKQVGIAALRSPSGEFLPAVPLYDEIEDDDKTEDTAITDVARLFADKMKQYVDGCRTAEIKI